MIDPLNRNKEFNNSHSFNKLTKELSDIEYLVYGRKNTQY